MQRRTDFLVIGSGIAGLRAAADLAAAGDVVILTKADPDESNTGYAQGGIAAAVGDDDHPDLHRADTIAAGDGLCFEPAVRVLVEDGVRYVRELVDVGRALRSRRVGRARARPKEAAHKVRRVLHSHDATGREIGPTRCGAGWPASRRVVVERNARASRRSSSATAVRRRRVRERRRHRADRSRGRLARHRRRRPGIPRHHQSGGRHRRRRDARVARGRAGRRSRVRAVPSDRAERARARRGSCCRRRFAVKARTWSMRMASAS